MMQLHTTDSLGKYIGKPVIFMEEEYILAEVEEGQVSLRNIDNVTRRGWIETRKTELIYPKLRDFSKLTVHIAHNGEDINPVDWIYGKSDTERTIVFESFSSGSKPFRVTLGIIKKLQILNFGAVSYSKSPTGYIDIWGNPCKLDEGK